MLLVSSVSALLVALLVKIKQASASWSFALARSFGFMILPMRYPTWNLCFFRKISKSMSGFALWTTKCGNPTHCTTYKRFQYQAKRLSWNSGKSHGQNAHLTETSSKICPCGSPWKHSSFNLSTVSTQGLCFVYRICRNKRPPEISAHQKQWFFKGGSTQKLMGCDGWFSKGGGEYTKPIDFDGWFFKGGGSTWNRWLLMGFE